MKIYIQTNTQSDAVIFAKEQFKKYLPKIFGSKITVTEEEKSDFTILLKEDAKIRGVKHDGLVHISEMSDSFVKDPSTIVSVGDIVKVKVLKIDFDKSDNSFWL